MNRQDAVARVTLLGAAASRPALTAAEVEAAVDNHRMVDAAGLSPAAATWDPTYDVNGAIAEVFRIKAARVAGDFNFSADDASFSKGDVLAHLLEMEAKYASMAGGPTGTGTANAGTIQVTGTNGPVDMLDRIQDRIIP